MSDLAARIAANLAYWSDVGPAVVRRDSELADQTAGRDMRQEARTAAYDLFLAKCRAVLAAGTLASPASDRAAEIAWEMAWHRDRGVYGDPAAALELTDATEFFRGAAESDYLATCLEKTGQSISDDEHKTRSARAAELERLTAEIAAKMEATGFPCHRETPFELWRYFVHSRQIERLPNYRRICFLPLVAQMLRAPMLAALEFWLSRHAFARFWTFTTGPRVELCGVRERVRWLHDKLSELNEQPFMREARVRLVFRATEGGTIETGPDGNHQSGGQIECENGQFFFHIHAHCVVEMAGGWIPPEKWSRLLEKVNAFWPFVFLEGGAIRSARECCKYLTKPAELAKMDGPALVALQAQLSRLKLVQPMGSLAAEISARENAPIPLRLVRRKTGDGGVFVVVKNWNRHGRRTAIEQNQDAAEKLIRRPARGLLRIVSRGAPRFGRCGVAEPVAVVMAMRGSLFDGAGRLRDVAETSIRSSGLLAPVIRATIAKFNAGVVRRATVLLIKVHTRTPTSGPDLATPETWRQSGQKQHHRGAARSGY